MGDPSSCAHSCQPRDRIQVRALLSQEMRTHRSLLVPSLLGALSLVHCQSEGHPLVNWLLPDIDVYTEMQPLAELQEKLDDFKTEFSDEEAIYRGECYDTMKKRLTLMIENVPNYLYSTVNPQDAQAAYNALLEFKDVVKA